MRPKTIEEKFSRYFIPTTSTNCWEWFGKKRGNGYGCFYWKGKYISAHRFSFQYFHKTPLSDLYVCHSCDNKKCVNPTHLFLGTNRDNILDAVTKGIHGKNLHRGETHYKATLYASDIMLIRRLAAKGFSHSHISDLFDIQRRSVTKIVNKTTWKHV